MAKLDWDKVRRAPIPPAVAREPLPGTFDGDDVVFEHDENGWKLILLQEADGSLSALRWDHGDGQWVKATPNQRALIRAAYRRS